MTDNPDAIAGKYREQLNPSALPTAGVLDQLIAECLELLKQAHINLLNRFALSAKNALRVEIWQFRNLLKELAIWAERSDDLYPLAHKARWWEWYWYEREYGDSQFTELSAEELNRLRTKKLKAAREYSDLWAITVDLDQLMHELVLAASEEAAKLPSLHRFSDAPDLNDLRFVFDRARPAMASRLTDAIGLAILKTEPERYTKDFLDFINQFDPIIKIAWSSDRSQIFADVFTSRFHGRSVSKESLGASARYWISHQISMREFDQEVQKEAEQDLQMLVEEIKEKVAA